MKIKVLFAILFLGLFFGISFFLYFQGRNNLKSTSFSGRIEKLSYGEKNIPTITVEGKRYNLTVLRKEFKQTVRIGDFIEKKSGTITYKITKQKTGEIINFEF